MSEDGYGIEDLERMIAMCQRNIDTLQRGIDREKASIDHFRCVKADVLEKKTEADAVEEINSKVMKLLSERLEESDGTEEVVVRLEDVGGISL